MNILFQLFVTIGILAAGLINFGSNYIHPWGWRLPLAIAGAHGLASSHACLLTTFTSLDVQALMWSTSSALQHIMQAHRFHLASCTPPAQHRIKPLPAPQTSLHVQPQLSPKPLNTLPATDC